MTITGQVTNASGAGIPNVTVRNTDTGAMALADANGYYSIDAMPEQSMEFTTIGYLGRQVSTEDLNYYNGAVVMAINAQQMPDVVITSSVKPSFVAIVTMMVLVTTLIILANKYVKI